ncbi:hypothetical protein tinsulaeT_35680 [Thalassotalea insulae]|uniref:Uncharacterized protein n=1 Tax=Thalassotalea insulae TaxID=2056778 RepID=A0ABQ6GWA9_9GAMM|nr:hypothetical protein [Thalassotalea insulae]GLX80228.1 hypothetical protein tinsulaeT_35680 [Thalassotalea insulae]
MKFEQGSQQSIMFVFEFQSLPSLRGAFKKHYERVSQYEPSIKKLENGAFHLRITKLIKYEESAILKIKNELIEDTSCYGGKFVEWKIHKVSKGDSLENKNISLKSKLVNIFTVAGDARTSRVYKMPFYSVLVILVIVLIISIVRN